jgi:hypothetical protein
VAAAIASLQRRLWLCLLLLLLLMMLLWLMHGLFMEEVLMLVHCHLAAGQGNTMMGMVFCCSVTGNGPLTY